MSFTESVVINNQVALDNLLVQQSQGDTIREIFNGLAAGHKFLSSRFFYDKTGSVLFEKITTLKEYYPTRTEKTILKNVAPTITGMEQATEVIELGSGDCSKVSILLDAFPWQRLSSTSYYPIDISESAILKSAEILSRRYPDIHIHGLMADFMKQLDTIPGYGSRLICFFGSTIGNLSRQKALEFLCGLRDSMHHGDSLLLGLDMVKEVRVLESAYNDDQGVTAAFNRNILSVINEIAKTNFRPGHFRHIAFYNKKEERIEMHLQAEREMEIHSPFFPRNIIIQEGETIHTENSHKFTPEHLNKMAEMSGMAIKDIYTDQKGWFSLVHFTLPED
jgi:L-histidine N-alpha-methyltransferase